MSDKNQQISKEELAKIKCLDDFDLTMLISEVHDHGWPTARKTLELMLPGREDRRCATTSLVSFLVGPRKEKTAGGRPASGEVYHGSASSRSIS